MVRTVCPFTGNFTEHSDYLNGPTFHAVEVILEGWALHKGQTSYQEEDDRPVLLFT